ncbi:hypothetical protein TVAG_082540 [Trichomonas vaginalis G3]|uniref:UDENN domain-containing protein n=1 Tax=Trichomonas vaginalis (strain ATCC PRA-98 / G3) TaxID=412133 RepID=A2FP91_TRIV3|nr:Rab guanyl-nucleotide exchange factor protein [Trichomonas vaginalis G3]EAX93281.1 hypothetical protein TVAG_082540 [Trichomonas vaginalis G3]KAI5513477.1 Rab guanyl-nucleotide exchange factor protein [Trichomonas vaginalis G3]|eukprot:XP_001306211.1 hypothetical protein [Trichomonas vaginalis G3]
MFKAFRKDKDKKAHKIRGQLSLDRITGVLSTKDQLESQLNQSEIEKENRLGKFLFILGPHEVVPDEIALLFVYPVNKFPYTPETIYRIKHFCYPNGMNCTVSKKESLQNQFVFTLNEDGKLFFGVCTHFYPSGPQFLSNSESGQPFCICTITQNPQLNQNFQFQLMIISLISNPQLEINTKFDVKLLQYEQKLDPGILENLHKFNPPLTVLSGNPIVSSINPSFIPPKIIDTLSLYLQISNQQNCALKLTNTNSVFITATESAAKQIASTIFDVLFSILSVKNVLKFLSAILTEQRIIVYGSDFYNISSVVLSAIPMISPLEYKGAFLPLVPNRAEFLDYLGTPIPYIFGVLKFDGFLTALNSFVDPSEVCMIDVDNDKLQFPESVPILPKFSELKNLLQNQLNQIGSCKRNSQNMNEIAGSGVALSFKWNRKNKYIFTPGNALKIQQIFTKYLNEMVGPERLSGCRVRDTTDPDNPKVGFVNDAYMIGINECDLDFVEAFIGTQFFQAYCEETFFS